MPRLCGHIQPTTPQRKPRSVNDRSRSALCGLAPMGHSTWLALGGQGDPGERDVRDTERSGPGRRQLIHQNEGLVTKPDDQPERHGTAAGDPTPPVPATHQTLEAEDARLSNAAGPVPDGTKTHTIEVRGHRLRVAVEPAAHPSDDSKPALLLCNGISAQLEALDPFVRAMPADRDIVRFDVPGVGGSPTPARPYRFSGLATLVAAMVRQLGYERIDVLGISWGGALAQQLAYQDTALCRRLVLVSTAPGSLMVPPHPRVLRHMATPRRYRDPVYGASIAGMIYGGSARQGADVALELLGRGAGLPTANGRGYLYQLTAAAGWTSLPLLPRIGQPTLIVAGTDDPLIPVANAKLMNRLLPHAALHLHSGGHLALGSEADALAYEITSFLDAPDLPSDVTPKAPAAPATADPQPKRSRLAVTARRSVGTAARVLKPGVNRLRSSR